MGWHLHTDPRYSLRLLPIPTVARPCREAEDWLGICSVLHLGTGDRVADRAAERVNRTLPGPLESLAAEAVCTWRHVLSPCLDSSLRDGRMRRLNSMASSFRRRCATVFETFGIIASLAAVQGADVGEASRQHVGEE